MNLHEVKYDCRHFRGGIPCKPNKISRQVCPTCTEYAPVSKRILIIKLGAIGDVIRTTPLIVKYRQLYPNCHITWVTQSPSILPKQHIDVIYPFDFTSLYIVRNQTYDIAINLDKENEACMLLHEVKASEKYGFTFESGRIAPATPNATHKLMTGFFDNLSQANTKSYPEEIFEICHLDFAHEEYLLNVNPDFNNLWNHRLHDRAKGKKIIGLNTGCGERWLTRMWPEKNWIALIETLNQKGYFPIVLGGPAEDTQNVRYAGITGVYYPGNFPLPEFMAIVNNCDVVVSAVSMSMHIAVGLKKPLVLFNNIFNKHEFDLYGRGTIIEPHTGCECYYGQSCKREKHCMEDLPMETVFEAIQQQAAALP